MLHFSQTRIARPAAMLLTSAVLILATGCVTTTGANAAADVIRGSGSLASEDRDVSGFSRIHLIGGGELRIEQGAAESLTIEAEDNLLEYLTSEVEGDTLILTTQEGFTLAATRPVIYRIAVQSLEGIEVDGGATIVASDLSLGDLDVSITGGATVTLSGAVDRQSITVEGGGAYHGEDMASQETTISITGAGAMTVRVEDRLDVTINGAGTVSYIGDPQVSETITGAGVVRKQ